jgi:Transposase domain (DUF772)
MIKQDQSPSFADVAVIHRTVSMPLFDRVNSIVDFSAIEVEISKYYQKGKSVDGRTSYPILVLFKMMLLQTWYGLSDTSASSVTARVLKNKLMIEYLSVNFVASLWVQKRPIVRYCAVLGRY